MIAPSARLMLFDLYHGGHHGQYVRALLSYWTKKALPGHLDLVVSREFADRYGDLVSDARSHPGVGVHPTQQPLNLNAKSGRLAVLRNDRRIGHVLREAIKEHRPTHCMLMYFDHVQLSLALNLRFDFPVSISGIYFRPSFYYRESGAAAPSTRARLDDLQKRALLGLALRNPHVESLLSLDPYAIPHIQSLNSSVRIRHVPEPFETALTSTETVEDSRRFLGVEPGREVMLLFGSLDPRKGVLQLMEAMRSLPAAMANRTCLLMAGEINASRGEILESSAHLASAGVQVIHLDYFISDPAEIHRLFGAASLVLMPYQNHVGSSNVLVRAAAAGKPVLGQAYGMLGAQIRNRRLGWCVDTTRPDAIKEGLLRFLERTSDYGFDPAAARTFASENTEEAMASTVFSHILAAS